MSWLTTSWDDIVNAANNAFSALAINNQNITNIKVASFNTQGAVTASTSTTTLDFSSYQGITLTLVSSQATAITLTSPPGPTACMLIIKQPASGMITPTWTTKPYALNGAITIATTASSTTLIGLIWDGSSWYASVSQPMSVIP